MSPSLNLKDWIAPARTALLLIDMQVDFAASDGLMAQAGFSMTAAQAAVEQAQELTAAARAAGVPCIFLRLITRPQDDSAMMREWRARHDDTSPPLCREGTRGAQFVGPHPEAGESVITKARYSGFTSPELDRMLKARKRDTLVLAGLTTECCVDATARDGFERDYHVFIARDGVAAYEAGLHQATLTALARNCALMADVAEIRAAWKT